MTPLRQQLKDLIELLSVIDNPPPPDPAFKNSFQKYFVTVQKTKENQDKVSASRELLSLLTVSSEEEARKRLHAMSPPELNEFCKFHKIPLGKQRSAKITKGRVIQKSKRAIPGKPGKPGKPARPGKAATKKKAAVPPIAAIPPTPAIPPIPAVPEIREPDLITPGISAYEATIENVLDTVTKLRNQAIL